MFTTQVKAFIGMVVALALIAGAYLIDHLAYQRGYDAHTADQRAIGQQKVLDATKAREDAARCAGDPNCSVRPDQYQRD